MAMIIQKVFRCACVKHEYCQSKLMWYMCEYVLTKDRSSSGGVGYKEGENSYLTVGKQLNLLLKSLYTQKPKFSREVTYNSKQITSLVIDVAAIKFFRCFGFTAYKLLMGYLMPKPNS